MIQKEMQEWPEYLLARAIQAPPEGCAVVPGSTPVVSFGHPLKPEVATLGINPSSREFLNRDKTLFSGSKRRLATLESIGTTNYADLDIDRAGAIISDCANYFDRRPYGWFNVLDKILTAALGVSYFHGSACHLDLVQWATDPVWRGLSRVQKSRLLDGDLDFLRTQLSHEGYRVVVVAGRTAMEWVQEAGLVKWKPAARLEESPSATFYVGDDNALRFVAWSCNLQNQPGARRHVDGLVKLLRKHAAEDLGGKTVLDGAFAKGTHSRDRTQLVKALKRWAMETDEDTIGDLSFRRAPWISFETPVGIADLNADTTRAAVERMLKHSGTHPGRPWNVIENRRGKVNKVVFNVNDTQHGWYAYLRESLAEPMELG